MEYKQPFLVDELKSRISSGVYSDMLPHTEVLAKEFGVNIKTMAKAIHQLVEAGLLERRRHCGTRIRRNFVEASAGDPMVEVIFEGFTTIFTHPFWGGIWDGLVSRLSRSGYRPVLHMLNVDPQTGMLDMSSFSLNQAVGRILLGIFDKRIFDAVQSSGVPFVSACDAVNLSGVPQVTFDFTYGIQKAVDYLTDRGHRRIAFIGQINPDSPIQIPHKYLAYRKAMENNGFSEFMNAENTSPLERSASGALERLLSRSKPDALIAAYDHQLPGILEALRFRSLKLPVIGCDGLSLEQLPFKRHMVKAPLNECGEAAARQLITAIVRSRPPASLSLPALFV